MVQLDSILCQNQHNTLLQLETLAFASAQVNCILGANGAGKSTLLKVISGDIPYQGTVTLHGRALARWPRLELARHLAVLPQASTLTFPFSAEEVVALGLTPLSISQRQGRSLIRQTMTMVDCCHLAKRPYPQLSGGERQRVQLARILVQISQAEQAPTLLLDEPTSAQDLGHQHKILALLGELAKQQHYGIISILHDLNQAIYYSDYACVLHQGRMETCGEPAHVLSDQLIDTCWQYHPERITREDKSVFLF